MGHLIRALVFSLLFHLGLCVTLELGKRDGWLHRDLPPWLTKWFQTPALVHVADTPAPWPIQPKRPREEPEPARKSTPPPDRFIAVDPVLAIISPPDDPKYYSTHSTRAADPKLIQSQHALPKVDGEEPVIPSLAAFNHPVVAPFIIRPDSRLGKTLAPVPPLKSPLRPESDAKSEFKPAATTTPPLVPRDEPPAETVAPLPAVEKLMPPIATELPGIQFLEAALEQPTNPVRPPDLVPQKSRVPGEASLLLKISSFPEMPAAGVATAGRSQTDAAVDFKPVTPVNPSPVIRNEPVGEAEARPAQPELARLAPSPVGAAPAIRFPEAPAAPVATQNPRPRTLLEAKANQALSGAVASKKMLQEGGISRHGKISFDVVGTAYGPYDALFAAAVQQRWWDLLENGRQAGWVPGEVRLSFVLQSNGNIAEVQLINSTVTEFQTQVCPATLQDLSPFLKWPEAMRAAIGSDQRRIHFRFIYW